MRKSAIAFLMVLFLLGMISCSSDDSETEVDIQETETVQQATVSPDASFSVPDLEGNNVSFDNFLGKGPLIVNFWGTWCPPCRMEMPDLQKIYDEYKDDGLQIVGLAIKDTPEQVKNYISKGGFNWTFLMATMESAKVLELGSGVPMTVFYDAEGNEIGRVTGVRDYEYFKSMVEKMI